MANNLHPRNSAELYKYCQKRKLQVDYKQISEIGPSHNLEFTFKAVIGDREFPEGKGRSKKEAKNNAASLALDILENEDVIFSLSSVSLQPSEVSEANMPSTINYIALLNDYTQKKRLSLTWDTETKFVHSTSPSFFCKCKVGDKFYDGGKGSTKKEAKQSAAKNAYEQIKSANDLQHISDSMSSQPSQHSSISENKTPLSTNYIALLNQYKQKMGLSLTFPIKPIIEPSGIISFSCTCNIGETTYGPGIGSNKQEAKHAASKIACEKMQLGNISQGSYSLSASASVTPFTTSSNSGNTSLSLSTSNGFVLKSGFSEDTSSSSPKSTSGSQQKIKRRLAANFEKHFDNNEKEEKEYSINERFLKDFEKRELLGTGGFGYVFKGRHIIDSQYYAIKRVKFDNVKVKREVEALAKLDHKNIVKYRNCWVGDDIYVPESSESSESSELNANFQRSKSPCLFIVMELCEGGTLKNWIDSRRCKVTDKTLPLNFFQQITEGVEYIHSQNLIHRDLKPSNIFLVNKIKIKIGDFGLVTSLKCEADRTKNQGTHIYMSPEQNYSQEYGNEVDIFALGLILFELLYICPTRLELSMIWENVRNCIFPEEFVKKYLKEQLIIRKLLSKEPEKRPKAFEILKILKSWESNIKTVNSRSY
ncbi:interferon-induced, double-stranded RNA-activated protein kinase isoform X2 [Macrotis lagotis]|uniref:interferon-induced, double-stranded RNA-activated protein kinase isoform X2 n=1 Tax=Macrotis lagotis TaxID=92651 RepID=UPI003D696C9A